MGGRAHGVAVARPLAVHGVSLPARPGIQARSMSRRRLRARRNSRAGGRARRHAGLDAADRQPQRARQDGERDRARRHRAAQPAAAVCALLARRNRGGVGFLEPDDAGARHPRAALGNRRPRPYRADRRSGGRNLSLFRPRRVHRARGRGLHHRRPRRGLEGRIRDARRASPRGNPRRDRQARLELHHSSHRPAGDRTAARAARASGRASSRGAMVSGRLRVAGQARRQA